jgi:transposase-like protein
MGHNRTYTWEFKLQMVQLLEKGEQNPSQISRDHHVTRSLLYVWWQLYQERGEAAFVPTQAFPASTRSRSTAECARTDCPSGTPMRTTGAGTGSATIGGGCAKKSLALGLATGSRPTATRAHRAGAGADAFMFGTQALPHIAGQPAVVLSASLQDESSGARPAPVCRHPGDS